MNFNDCNIFKTFLFLRNVYLATLLPFLLSSIFVCSITHNQLTVMGTEIDDNSIAYVDFSFPAIRYSSLSTLYSLYPSSLSFNQTITHSISEPQNVLPPDIKMNYNGTEYDGRLIAYKYRQTPSFGQLDPLTKELSVRDAQTGELGDFTSSPEAAMLRLNSSLYEIPAQNGSKVKFTISNSPAQLPPESLSVTAYTLNPTKAVKVLEVDEQDPSNTSFRINLEKGKYLLLATSTWIASSTGDERNNNISGYAIYAWSTEIL